jgi:hypothetical protein
MVVTAKVVDAMPVHVRSRHYQSMNVAYRLQPIPMVFETVVHAHDDQHLLGRNRRELASGERYRGVPTAKCRLSKSERNVALDEAPVELYMNVGRVVVEVVFAVGS